MNDRTAPPPTADPSPSDDAALAALVRLMLIDLALGLIVAAVTWIFHDVIVSHQVAAGIGGSAEELSVTLWSRPAPSLVVAAIFPLMIRRLRKREGRAWRRVVVLACIQVLALSWYAFGGGYPWWLIVVVVLQVLAAIAVLAQALQPRVRRQFRPQARRSGSASHE